jgi:hypothetical protein
MQRSQEVSVFKKYMHLEKFGNEEVEGIELGRVFVFPNAEAGEVNIFLNFLNDCSTMLSKRNCGMP